VVLTRIPCKESLNRPDTAGFFGAKPKRKTLFAKREEMAQKKLSDAKETSALFMGKLTIKTGPVREVVKTGHTKTHGSCCFCDTCVYE
jgi:hypothetical protein